MTQLEIQTLQSTLDWLAHIEKRMENMTRLEKVNDRWKHVKVEVIRPKHHRSLYLGFNMCRAVTLSTIGERIMKGQTIEETLKIKGVEEIPMENLYRVDFKEKVSQLKTILNDWMKMVEAGIV